VFNLLINHPEHGLVRLRDDYYARRRALLGGTILAAAVIVAQVLKMRFGINPITAGLIQAVTICFGFALALIHAAWVNNPRQTVTSVMVGTFTGVLLAFGGALIAGLLVVVVALLPSMVGGLPTIGGALMGFLGVALGGIAGIIMVLGAAAVTVLTGYITLRVAAGADVDDELVNAAIRAAGSRIQFVPTMVVAVAASLIATAASGVVAMGTNSLLKANVKSEGIGDLAGGLEYLFGLNNVGVTVASTGTTDINGLIAGVVTAIGAALVFGTILALPLAMTARSILIFLQIDDADMTVAHAISLRVREEAVEEPPPAEEPADPNNPDLSEFVQRPDGWRPPEPSRTRRRRGSQSGIKLDD